MSSVDRPRTRLDPNTRRELIVDAAERLLGERGHDAVTFEDLADAAGVSRALVYNYFGDRNGLLAEVYLRVFDRLSREVGAGLDPALEPVDQVRAMARGYLRFARANPGTWRLLATSAAVSSPEVRHARHGRAARLAELWGGSDDARVTACAVTGLLEAATDDFVEHGGDADHVVHTLGLLASGGLAELAGRA